MFESITQVASANPVEAIWVQTFAQLATAGGFGGLVWYFIVRYIPAKEDRHREERLEWEKRHKEERDDRWKEHLTRMDTRDRMLEKALEAHATQLKLLTDSVQRYMRRNPQEEGLDHGH